MRFIVVALLAVTGLTVDAMAADDTRSQAARAEAYCHDIGQTTAANTPVDPSKITRNEAAREASGTSAPPGQQVTDPSKMTRDEAIRMHTQNLCAAVRRK